MKIRTDFVSNSSTCSFIINDVKKCIGKVKIFNNVYIPFEIDNVIDVYLYTKYKNWNFVKDNIEKFIDKEYRCSPIIIHADEDSISWDYFAMTFSQFVNICSENNSFEEIFKYVEYICFMTRDMSSHVIYLNQLYTFFDINGCKPDNSSSEHDFTNDETTNFFKLLNTKITKNVKNFLTGKVL